MEDIRQKLECGGRYHDLKPLGRRIVPGKGAVAENLGQSKFTSRGATKLSQKRPVAQSDFDEESSEDDIDAFSSKNKATQQAHRKSKAAKAPPKENSTAAFGSRPKPRPAFKNAKTGQTSAPSTQRPPKATMDIDSDESSTSNQIKLNSKKPWKSISQHGTPLEELSPNRAKKLKVPKSGTRKLKPEPFPMKDESCTAKSKVLSPKRSPPRLSAFPMEVPSQTNSSRKWEPAPAPFSAPSSPRPNNLKRSLQRFPLDSPSSSPHKDDSGEDEDELKLTDDDAVTTYGGPRPFPMSLSQFPEKPPGGVSGSKRSSREEEEPRASKKARPSPKSSLDLLDSAFEPEDFGFLSLDGDDNVDPSALCPYCDEPWPPSPSPTLIALLERTKRKSYRDPRPGNSMGLKAPLATFVELCQRHRFEMTHLPLARARGWPTHLDFARLPKRIAAFRKELGKLIREPEDSMFWREIRDDAKEVGIMKVVSVSGQYATFERAQPGYYGEQGSIIIHQSLYSLFPPDGIPPTAVAPLTPDQFLTRVLVPETAVLLVQQDMDLPTKVAAHRVLDESRKYGIAMFPEQAQGEEAAEVGEHLARERARVRRKVLEERGEADADVEREVERERRQARKAKGKEKESSKAKGKGKDKESGTESDPSQQSGQERPKKGKRKAKESAQTPPFKNMTPTTVHRQQDEGGDVRLPDESEEPTPRLAKKIGNRRDSSTASWRSNTVPSSSPSEVVIQNSSSRPPSRQASNHKLMPSRPTSLVDEEAQWSYTLRDSPSSDVDSGGMIADFGRKENAMEKHESDSDVVVIDVGDTPKPKLEPRRVARANVVQSEESTGDESNAVKKARPKLKTKPTYGKEDVLDGGDVEAKGALGQTKRRKKGKHTVKEMRSDESGGHSWLLSDSSV